MVPCQLSYGTEKRWGRCWGGDCGDCALRSHRDRVGEGWRCCLLIVTHPPFPGCSGAAEGGGLGDLEPPLLRSHFPLLQWKHTHTEAYCEAKKRQWKCAQGASYPSHGVIRVWLLILDPRKAPPIAIWCPSILSSIARGKRQKEKEKKNPNF